jgi:hypothetical protein
MDLIAQIQHLRFNKTFLSIKEERGIFACANKSPQPSRYNILPNY